MDYSTESVVLCLCFCELSYKQLLFSFTATNFTRAGVYLAVTVLIGQQSSLTDLNMINQNKIPFVASLSTLSGLLTIFSILSLVGYFKRRVFQIMQVITILSYCSSLSDFLVAGTGLLYCISVSMADDTFKDFQDFIGLSEDQIITLTDNLRIFYIAFSLFLLFSIYEFYVTRLYQQTIHPLQTQLTRQAVEMPKKTLKEALQQKYRPSRVVPLQTSQMFEQLGSKSKISLPTDTIQQETKLTSPNNPHNVDQLKHEISKFEMSTSKQDLKDQQTPFAKQGSETSISLPYKQQESPRYRARPSGFKTNRATMLRVQSEAETDLVKKMRIRSQQLVEW